MLGVLKRGLDAYASRFAGDVAGAKALLGVGASPPDAKLDPVELAAYTAAASVMLNLDEVVTKE